MKAVFNKEAKKSKLKIDYGTVLLCQLNSEDDFDLYRVACESSGFNYRLDMIHDRFGDDHAHFSGTYSTTSELIDALKNAYDIIQIVDAHIVIDKIVGQV